MAYDSSKYLVGMSSGYNRAGCPTYTLLLHERIGEAAASEVAEKLKTRFERFTGCTVGGQTSLVLNPMIGEPKLRAFKLVFTQASKGNKEIRDCPGAALVRVTENTPEDMIGKPVPHLSEFEARKDRELEDMRERLGASNEATSGGSAQP